jgi:2-polyprenyl-6-methoxyphenol hydroxylase-like FAD-dependent oxidoreductase
VTLVGDAAHPMLPHTGQGAAQTLVDAVRLGRWLSIDAPIESALRGYERERQPKTATLVEQGRRTARLLRATNPTLCTVRELAIRILPVEVLVKILVPSSRR